ncbi:MAG: DMT family transporter [Clostridiales bacterium]|nr:DMT family transporter [Clostridiales bacterium]
MSDKNKGNLILLLTAILWGSGFISQKLGNRVMPPMTFNAVRQLMAAVVLTPIVLRGLKASGYFSRESNTASQLDDRKKRAIKGGILCGIFMLIGTATQQIGLLTVSAGKSGFISSIYIVFTPLFSVIVGSKVKRRTVICIAIAMIGFAVMSLKDGISGATAGDWLTLVSAAGFAAQIVVVNQFVDKDNAVLLSQLQFLFCGAAGLVVALLMEGPAWAGVLAGIPVLLYQTFVPTAGGYTLQIIGQKYTDSSTAALIMSLESVFAMIFGALFLHEIMSAREIAGAAIIFAATILGQRE